MIDEITGEKHANKKIAFGVVLAAALTIMSITALAAGIAGIFGNANWMGDVIPEEVQEQQSYITPAPPAENRSRELFELEWEILSSRGERELVIVSDGKTAVYAPRIQNFHNLAEFEATMETTVNLPVPIVISDGYSLTDGYVVFDCLPEGEFLPTSVDTLPEGITVSRYRVEEAMDFVSGYELRFNGTGKEDYISVLVDMVEHSDISEHSFGINPDQQVQTAEVPEMDNALLITSNDGNYLAMRRMLPEPIEFLAYDRSEPDTQSRIDTYEECQVHLYASRLSKESLTAMFASH